MSGPSYTRDGILSQQDRDNGARRCLQVIASASAKELESKLSERDRVFYDSMRNRALYISGMNTTEKQLAWLRDICEKLTS